MLLKGCVPVFLRKTIVTCDFSGLSGPPVFPLGPPSQEMLFCVLEQNTFSMLKTPLEKGQPGFIAYYCCVIVIVSVTRGAIVLSVVWFMAP